MEKNTNQYYEMYSKSIDKNKREDFWYEQSKEISYIKPPKKSEILTQRNKKIPIYEWFPNIELNICYNCLDRHIKNNLGNENAIIFESYYLNKIIKITYNELYKEVNLTSFILQKNNIKKGDRIIIYMPTIPEGIISMLSCCRIGAIHSVVFGGFAYYELSERIKDSNPKMIIISSCGIEPKRVINYYNIVNKAIEFCGDEYKNNIKILIFQRYDSLYIKENEINRKNTLIYNEEIEKIKNKNINIPCVKLKGNDIFFILYTSGTSGIPKGIVHDNSSIITINFTMKYIMNIYSKEIVFSTSDIGWIVGHIFIVYGPLLRGATTVIFEGKPIGTPNPGKIWEIIEKFKIKAFYTAPTALRSIKQNDPNLDYLKKYNINTLESIHLSGERCDSETYIWLKDNLDKKLLNNNNIKNNNKNIIINDQWWQTETGWPICCNNLGIKTFTDLKPGISGPPLMGYLIKILDENNLEELPINKNGIICIELPLPPGFMKTLFGNDEIFLKKYISKNNKYYITGDIGFKNEKGYICIMGRNDDMIKISGHRLSTGKIEEIINQIKNISECAVVSLKDKLKGEVPFGFIVCEKGTKNLNDVINEVYVKVVEKIGKICSMKCVIIVDKLPKTRSGKIIRVLLKQIVNKEKIYIPPTIEDKSVVKDILVKVNKAKY